MSDQFLRQLHLTNFLSFGPNSEPVELAPLNVLIGPNGAGKSNFIEALELLHATPSDFSEPIRIGGTAGEWLWKGTTPPKPAIITAKLRPAKTPRELRYRLAFTQSGSRLEVVDEALEEATRQPGKDDVFFYYRYQNGHPVINVQQVVKDEAAKGQYIKRQLQRETLNPEQSVLSQRKDPDLYPEVTRVAVQFERIQIFREWGFGRGATLRQPQPANLPTKSLLPSLVNLGLVLNDLEHRDCWPRFNELMRRFLPRFSRLTTKIENNSVQIYLHEDGLKAPVPAARLSDGTIRYLALLSILLNAEAAPLICIEEPELGLHPDALSVIAELLIEASTLTQLVVTTHSDVLVSALSDHADSIMVCEHGLSGTEFHRLDQTNLKDWLERYSLGDLWLKGELGGVRW